MNVIDLVLRPGTLLLLSVGGVVAGFWSFERYYFSDKQGTDGLVLGLFAFASASLIAAVVRRGQLREGD